MTEKQKLAREFSTRSRTLKPVPYSNSVVEVSATTGQLYELSLKELRFLHHLRPYFSEVETAEMSYGQAIEQAALAAGVERGWAERYLSSKKYRRWAEDRMGELAVRMGVTVEYLMGKHKENIDGTAKRLNMSQQKSLEELGERIWPKTSRVEHQVEAKDSRGMDEMMKVREEVEALEKKLQEKVASSGIIEVA